MPGAPSEGDCRMRKYLVEFIGTFFLVLTVVLSVDQAQPLAAVAIGSALMVMVYAGGHISGGHYNPGVSLAAFVRGRLSGFNLLPYWASQLAGALVAALVGMYLVDYKGQALSLSGGDIGKALVVEFLFAFALCYVVLNVATSKDHQNNSFYGLAIGFTVLVGAVAAGAISGAAFNSAVAFGATIAGILEWSSIWIYVVANLAAGVVAGVVFKFVNADDP
jgi:aquaporin Z